MSKENNNLRLLGSPVNLSYRNKKTSDKKSVRNRPRSALQTSCITPIPQERYKRPFSADAQERGPTTRSLLKAFSAELLDSYNNSPLTVKVVAPTEELLGERKPPEKNLRRRDICSNASDYGSEDTFISLGTKIKAKAQSGSKPKNTNSKNFIKYRNSKKIRKPMESMINEGVNNEYGMEVKITERQKTPSPTRNKNMFNERSFSPTLKTRPYESYFIPLDSERRESEESLLGRVSFGSDMHLGIEQAINKYSSRLNLTKQQLSLVEEESIQDPDSVPSHSLSPENSIETDKSVKADGDLTDRNTYVVHNYMCEPRTYTSFYDDFRTDNHYKSKLSSTVVLTDTSSKDSGYHDSGTNDERSYKHNYSLPTTSLIKKAGSHNGEDQPKSLDSASTSSAGYQKPFPDSKEQWAEPLNHSRLLYKDFFLKKEGHIAQPPPSPTKTILAENTEGDTASSKTEQDMEYPSYLVNSTTKAYTSKVIEDYKKELEAINNLHQLTIKDIQTDAISPTPLNIDKMFEDNASNVNDKKDNSPPDTKENEKAINNQTSYEMKQRRDIAKISTKELIQNYLKVKEGDIKEYLPKNSPKFDKKINNTSKYSNIPSRYKEDWNNKTPKSIMKNLNSQVDLSPINTIQNTKPRVPISARIDSVQHDKDIDSWMSLSAPSPRIIELDAHAEEIQPSSSTNSMEASEESKTDRNETDAPAVENDDLKAKELNSHSTVLDIYSMLKEIESYGDNPVTTTTNTSSCNMEVKEEEAKDEGSAAPKDHFLEIFEFLENVEKSANDALSIVTNNAPQNTPKLETLLKLPQTELAQRLVTASLQLEERSCCIALLQESLTNHKEQMIKKVSNLEKQAHRNMARVKQDCEETVKRHQTFIDQLINEKKTLNHRIEQLFDERRSLEERWKRSAAALEERYKLELRNQHDKMAAAQQVARQRWVRQKAEKIKELTVKGLEGELREMAERQQKEISDLKMLHAEHIGRSQAKHAQELEEVRRRAEEEKEAAVVKERQMASARLEKQMLEIELTYQEQRTRLITEMRAENERVACGLSEKERAQREEIDKWRQEQERILDDKKYKLEKEIASQQDKMQELLKQKEKELQDQFEQYKLDFEAEQQMILKKKVTDIAAQHKQERDREIEKAIESMDAEAQAGRRELQDAMRRNKEQYEAELKELAETEQATLRRYQEAQARVRSSEDKCAELEVAVNQLETRNRVLTEKNIQLEGRIEEIRAESEAASRDKMAAALADAEQLRRTHDEQMHQLYAKVKVAVARKDSAIQALTREAAKYQEKITLLEQKLSQQRKDFLKAK